MKAFFTILFCILTLISNAIGTQNQIREAFLNEDVYELGDPQKTNGNVFYPLSDSKFDELFPDCEEKGINIFSGQIANNKDLGVGTGTLIGLSDHEKGKRALGITTLHTFLSDDLAIPTKFSRKFYQGLINEGGDTFSHIGFVKIDDIKVNPLLEKDFCVFTGFYMRNSEVFDNDEIVEKFLVEVGYPKFGTYEHEEICSIYHYPLGTKGQRINKGKLLKSDQTHRIRTCAASSGSALFKKNEIIGLHKGTMSSSISPNEFILYEGKLGKRTTNVTSFNAFEFIGVSDVEQALNGVSLYDFDEEFSDKLQAYSKQWKEL